MMIKYKPMEMKRIVYIHVWVCVCVCVCVSVIFVVTLIIVCVTCQFSMFTATVTMRDDGVQEAKWCMHANAHAMVRAQLQISHSNSVEVNASNASDDARVKPFVQKLGVVRPWSMRDAGIHQGF
jgi:hypothetical protein